MCNTFTHDSLICDSYSHTPPKKPTVPQVVCVWGGVKEVGARERNTHTHTNKQTIKDRNTQTHTHTHTHTYTYLHTTAAP